MALPGTEIKNKNYIVNNNFMLVLGSNDVEAAKAKMAQSGFQWGDDHISVAVYIAKSIKFDTMAQLNFADPSVTDVQKEDNAPTPEDRKPNVYYFSDHKIYASFLGCASLLMVDADLIRDDLNGTKGVYALTNLVESMGTINDPSWGMGLTHLYIDGAKAGERYNLFQGKDSPYTNFRGLNTDAISSDNGLLKFKEDPGKKDGGYEEWPQEYHVIAYLVNDVDDAYGKGKVIAPKAYDTSATDAFFTAATNSKVNGAKDNQAMALNSAAALGELAGVEHGTYAASHLLTDAVSDHMSLANDKTHDKDLWAKYIHMKENVDGLAIANFGANYDAQYNGIVVGTDLYQKGKFTLGAALTYADGNISGHTTVAGTKNDATYYGASLYGSIRNGDSALIGDISYLHSKNDITQYNSGYNLTADAKSDAFSVGVRAEKSVKTGAGKLVPYAGIRYMHLGTGNYTNSVGMSYDSDDMNLWLLPVGVKYSADVKAGSWTVRPVAEVGYVWNMGDRDAAQTLKFHKSDSFNYDVTDSGNYIGRLGVEAEKANISYGLGYEYQKGNSTKANRWTANLNWKF